MNPIKAVKHDSSRDSFIDIVGNDLTQLSSILDNGVKEANKEHQKMKKFHLNLIKIFIQSCKILLMIAQMHPTYLNG